MDDSLVVLSCSYSLVFSSTCRRCLVVSLFFFQAEDGIRDLVRSRGLGDVYKRQQLAKPLKLNPRDIAGRLLAELRPSPLVARAEVALSLIHI